MTFGRVNGHVPTLTLHALSKINLAVMQSNRLGSQLKSSHHLSTVIVTSLALPIVDLWDRTAGCAIQMIRVAALLAPTPTTVGGFMTEFSLAASYNPLAFTVAQAR